MLCHTIDVVPPHLAWNLTLCMILFSHLFPDQHNAWFHRHPIIPEIMPAWWPYFYQSATLHEKHYTSDLTTVTAYRSCCCIPVLHSALAALTRFLCKYGSLDWLFQHCNCPSSQLSVIRRALLVPYPMHARMHIRCSCPASIWWFCSNQLWNSCFSLNHVVFFPRKSPAIR